MPTQILSGSEAASALLKELKPKIKELDPKLVIVQVGQEPSSLSYIRKKLQSCQEVGLRAEHRELPLETTFEELLKNIEEFNNDDDVTGIIVQLPLPHHLQSTVPLVQRAIHPKKDVDGFTAYNLGKMFLGTEFEHLPPATPAGIISLLEYYKIPIEGKNAVVVGRSNIVGKPLAIMLLNRNATVTICHSKTLDLRQETLEADILIAAMGKPKFITVDMVKPGAVVIDVGVNRLQQNNIQCHAAVQAQRAIRPVREVRAERASKHEVAPKILESSTKFKLVGDVDFDAVKEVASAITPVPGGVGPMTVASLIRNVVRAKERQMAIDN